MTGLGSMRQVVVSTTSIDVVQAPVPEPAPNEVLVRTVFSGICGSDTHAAHGLHPFIPIPYHPGHEVVGVIEGLGSGVERLAVGQRVTVEPDLPCWNCKMCRSGRQNLCENLGFFGCGAAQGGMADYFTINADRLHRIPDDLDDRAAALIEPLSTPVHAVRLAGDIAGKAVAILGAGTIGLLVLAAVRAHAARAVVVTDMLASKRERALRLGADAAVDAGSHTVATDVRTELGESADVVFDCVANEHTVRQGIAIAGKGGTVVIVGVPSSDVSVPLPIIQDQQIRLQGSATYLPEDFEESIKLLHDGRVRADELVTAILPVERVADAFKLSSSGEHVKVLVSLS